MTIRHLSLSLLLAALLTSTAGAQGFKDGPHIALPRGEDVQNERAGYGWQASYEFSNFASIDATVTRQEDELAGDTIDVPGFPAGSEIDLDILSVALTGRLSYPIDDWLMIYGGLGVGFYWFNSEAQNVRIALDATPLTGPRGGKVENANVDIEKDFGFHAAIGIEVLLSEHWEVFAEFRKIGFDTDAKVEVEESFTSPTLAGARRQTDTNQGFDYDHGLFRLGLNYRF